MKNRFSVNITNCRHELPLLKELIQIHNWEEVYIKDKPADLIWLFPLKKEESMKRLYKLILDLQLILSTKAIYNRLPGL